MLKLEVSGSAIVSRNGDPVPLGRAVLGLLVALGSRYPEFVDRKEIARLLSLAPDALRQLIRRTRLALGADCLILQGSLIALDTQWQVNLHPQTECLLEYPFLAQESEAPIEPSEEVGQAFVSLIKQTAMYDVDEARHLLVSAEGMSKRVPTPVINELLNLTRPTSTKSHRWGAFQNMRYQLAMIATNASLPYISSKLESAKKTMRANGEEADYQRAKLVQMFAAAAVKGTFLPSLKELRKPRSLYERMAMSSLLWHENRHEESIQMLLMAKDSDFNTTSERLHYLSNLAVFARYPLYGDIAAEACRKIESLPNYTIDRSAQRSICLSRAYLYLHEGDMENGQLWAAKYKAVGESMSWNGHDWTEWQICAALKIGNIAAARQYYRTWWSSISSLGLGNAFHLGCRDSYRQQIHLN